MDMPRLRSSIKQQVLSTVTPRVKKKHYSQVEVEAIIEMVAAQAIDLTLKSRMPSLATADPRGRASSFLDIQEQEENENEDDADVTVTEVDKDSIARALGDNIAIWQKMDIYEVSQSLIERSCPVFMESMIWLDEILATAKSAFETSEIVPLPKTPAAKKRRPPIKRKSSVDQSASPIIKPKRSKRAASVKAQSKMTQAFVPRVTRKTSRLASIACQESASPAVAASTPNTLTKASVTSEFNRLPRVRDKVEAYEKIIDANTPGKVNFSTAEVTEIEEDTVCPTPVVQSSIACPLSFDDAEMDTTLEPSAKKPPRETKISKANGSVEVIATKSSGDTSAKKVSAIDSEVNKVSSTESSITSVACKEVETRDSVSSATPAVDNLNLHSDRETEVTGETGAGEVSEPDVALHRQVDLSDTRENLDIEAGKPTSGTKSVIGKTSATTLEADKPTSATALATDKPTPATALEADKPTSATALEANKPTSATALEADKLTSATTLETDTLADVVMEADVSSPNAASETETSPSKRRTKSGTVGVQKPALGTGYETKRTASKGKDVACNDKSTTHKPNSATNSDKSKLVTDEKVELSFDKLQAEETLHDISREEDILSVAVPPPAQPMRMTRSKMRAPPPEPEPVIHPKKTPLRVKSPARIRVASSDRTSSKKETYRFKTKQSDTESSKLDRSRTTSDSGVCKGSSVTRPLTKAASSSRINSSATKPRLNNAHSTPDMNRTQSLVRTILNVGRTTPQNTPSLNKTIVSFIKRATPQKTLSKEEQLEIKGKKLKEKQEAEKQRLEEAERHRLQQMELKKKERMEKMKKVQEARQAKIKALADKHQELEKKSQQKAESSSQAQERKIREEKERAFLREQKLHEAEERRKKDEQLRLKKLKASDAEQKRQAEAMARKKEYSEAERQRKIQEAERHKIIEAAKQETLRKMEMDRLNQGKSKQTTAGTPSTSTSKPKTSIYEVLSNKAAAMSEQRKALMTTLTESSSSKKTDDKLNTTFTKPERQNFIDIKLTHEDDEFDDPKFAKCKKPAWAEGSQFNTAVISQYEALKTGRLQPSNVFGKFACCMPDLTKMFPVHKPRFFHRTSSAKWSSPPLNNERRASKRVKR